MCVCHADIPIVKSGLDNTQLVCFCLHIYSGRLRAGHAELRLWKGEENKRAGDSVVTPNLATHPANNPHLNAVKLHITFQRVTTGPIIYPSTRGESRSIFMKSARHIDT